MVAGSCLILYPKWLAGLRKSHRQYQEQRIWFQQIPRESYSPISPLDLPTLVPKLLQRQTGIGSVKCPKACRFVVCGNVLAHEMAMKVLAERCSGLPQHLDLLRMVHVLRWPVCRPVKPVLHPASTEKLK